MTASFSVTLPMPPSVNSLTVNDKANGRRRSPAYSGWLSEAGWRINEARGKGNLKNLPADTWYWTDLRLPHTHLGDSDNRLKAVHDLLHKMHTTPDDKWLLGGTYMRCPDIEPGTCVVCATAIEDGKSLGHWQQIKLIADRMVEAETGNWQSIGAVAQRLVENARG